jgi:cold shock CspA family protein
MSVHVDVEVEGVVRRYDLRQPMSFGFVTPTDAALEGEIFVDSKCVKKSGLQYLKKGTRVRCFCVRGQKGLKAKRIQLLS